MRDWTVHGGRIDAARAAYPDAPQPWLDLSTGINPHAWRGLDPASVDLRALPGVAALEAAAAAMFGAVGLDVAAVPGSEIGLRALAALDLPAPRRFVAPGYGTHGAALPDARPIAFHAIEAAAAAGGTLLLANPNNPDGRVMSADAVRDLAARLAWRGGWLIVDEAFADAVPGASVVPLLRAGDAVLVVRSFGKFFGLAGLRLGFVLGPAPVVALLRARMGSWPVSSLAIAIGTAAYRDAAWIAAMRTRLAREAEALDRMLAAQALTPRGACPLFRLVEMPAAAATFERLARAGILTRPFADGPGWLRLGLPPDAAALARLERALAGG